jgi:uncharacterized protein
VVQKHADQERKPNRLAGETSTYLLQHAYNPVEWHPWNEEALQRARAEDKPILLSVGYSACHWCHVMEHESFEDEDTAALMNRHFINIKVDREERPDIDEIYMKAVQMLTGHGGWPMTVFLTPNLKPFYGGTYFPPEDRHGMPSFKKLLNSVNKAWTEQRKEVEESSEEITHHLAVLDEVKGDGTGLEDATIIKAVSSFLRAHDSEWGGFGGAPKFPHTASLSLMMRFVVRLGRGSAIAQDVMEAVNKTLDKMAYGGMQDQVGGGFARYSVDRYWLIPHFEKMLYDNALLVRNYLDGYLLTGRDYWKEVARNLLDFVLRELTTPEGAFYSSLDADSEGEEGKFYVWKPEEIIEILGKKDGEWFNQVYGVGSGGNFEHGSSVLYFREAPEKVAAKFKMSDAQFWANINPLRQKVLTARESRVRPGRDDKILTSWSSLMISGFVDGYRVLQDKKYLDAARTAARFIINSLIVDGVVMRTYGRGEARLKGYLDDYSYLVQALLDLSQVDFDPLWYETAVKLTRTMLEKFSDAAEGNLFYTSDDHESLIARTKNFADGSIPSATSVAVMNLLRLGRLTGEQSFTERAEDIMATYSSYFAKAPSQFANMLCALDFHLAPPSEVALVVPADGKPAEEMLFAANSAYLPNTVDILKDETKPSSIRDQSPLLEGRGPVDGKPTAYVCKSYTCDAPNTSPSELTATVKQLAGTST